MIRRIEALNYKCLRYVSQELDDFHVLVGPNGSGKSTFLDVVALMRDVVRGGHRDSLDEAITTRAPNFRDLLWRGQGTRLELAIEAEIPSRLRQTEQAQKKGWQLARYELAIGEAESGELGILAETLRFGPKLKHSPRQFDLFPSPLPPKETILTRPRSRWKAIVNKVPGGNDNFYAETGGWDHKFRLGPRKSALANLPEDESKFPVATWFKTLLRDGVERVVLNARQMQRPCPPNVPRDLKPDGSNIAWVVHALEATAGTKALEQWCQTVQLVLPEIKRIRTVERPEDRFRYLVLEYQGGVEVPSWLVSDGTLRMLALTLIPFLPKSGLIYLIEEPENGVHPTALETIFQCLSHAYGRQVLLASHSPQVARLASPEQVLCFARADDGAVDVVRGSEHPRLRAWREKADLGLLLPSGVLS